MKTSLGLRLCTGLVLALGATAALRAQNVLCVEHAGKVSVVRSVRENLGCVDNGTGKLVLASGTQYALQPVPSYVPFYVTIRHLAAIPEAVDLEQTGETRNNRFEFRGEFESAVPLDNVFVVLELETKSGTPQLFLQEVGRLEANKPRFVMMRRTPIAEGLDPHDFHYRVHVFADGAETFHSEMPTETIQHGLDALIRRRITGVTDAPPRPFMGPVPEYPEALRNAKVKGRAVIRFTITPTGQVVDPTVKSATEPAFGNAALAAARQWRFLPRVKAGVPTATTVDFPFDFDPHDSVANAP